MTTFLGIIFGIAIIGCAWLICGYKDLLMDKSILNKYKKELKGRIPLKDSDFCTRAKLPIEDEALVRKTREAFGKLRGVEPDLIYPEDDVFTSLGLPYDDDLASFLTQECILEKNEWWFPSEELKQFSDIFPLIHRMNNSEQGSGGNG